jgi:serine/threonine-protein kinase
VRADTVTGEVWVNNTQVTTGTILPKGCVIALGGPARKASDRVFVTMDVSHPEVVL